jgi:hypothetical protein
MKKHIFSLALLLVGLVIYSQEVLKLQNGATLTVQAGAEITIFGGITLDNGSVLSNNGTVTIKQNGASGAADFFDNTITAYSYGSGKFVFNGPAGHTIYSNNNFGRIDIDAADFTIASNITANKWWLANGKVNTGNNRAIVLGTASTDLEAAPSNPDFINSWINGNLRRYINPLAVNYYRFAIGSSSSNRNILDLNNMSSSPITGVQYIDASFGPKPGTDAGLMVAENGIQYVMVNAGGVWRLLPDNAPSSGKYDLSLFFNGFSGLADNSFGILQRPNLLADAAEWNVPAGSSLNPANGAGRLVTDNYALRKDISVFGQFGIGQLSAALPVNLSGFNARRISKSDVALSWETATESNSKGFAIERRTENENAFTKTGFINSKAPGGNSSSALHYDYTDNNGYSGISYYRLKQTDLDNREYYSVIKAVKGLNGNGVSVLLWPNPNKGQFSIKIDGNNGQKEAIVTDLQGRTMKKVIINGNQQVNVYDLPAGAYILTIPGAFGNNENFKEKILVIK